MKKLFFFISAGFFLVLSTFLLGNKFKDNTVKVSTLTTAIDCSKAKGIEKVVCLAEAFKATLKDDQLSLLQLEYSEENAVRWSNFPQAFSRPNRVGISLGSLNATQLFAAKTLMTSVLSESINEGYDELEGILAADDYFAKATGQANTFGHGNYYIAFLGKPSASQLWELQFGGHHFAFANTYNKGKITGVTPAFRGVEPMAAVVVNGRTYQPMKQERESFSNIIASLSDGEKGKAKLNSIFGDLLLGPGADGKFPITKSGIKIGDLNSTKQKQVLKAIELYVMDLDSATAKLIMKKYADELSETYISYSGTGTMSKENDYVRIDGPGIWIEYSAQPSRDFPGTTHAHSVWRDHTTDYGGN